jgi:hypothetical protein
MLRSKMGLALLALAVTAFALPALSGALGKNQEVIATLKGKNEVPGPGATKGSSDIFIILKPNKHKLCFTFSVKKLDPITEGDINKGLEGKAGPQKVTLFSDQKGIAGTGSYDGCVAKLKPSLLDKIAAAPESYYVEYHTLDFPEGAIRGQLALPPH